MAFGLSDAERAIGFSRPTCLLIYSKSGRGGLDAAGRRARIMVSAPTPPGTTFEAVIGLEVHCQLLTASKMFCGCSTEYAGAPPNTHVCPVCLGMPGVLPVINRRAVALTLMTGLALNCEIPAASKFDRKNYP